MVVVVLVLVVVVVLVVVMVCCATERKLFHYASWRLASALNLKRLHSKPHDNFYARDIFACPSIRCICSKWGKLPQSGVSSEPALEQSSYAVLKKILPYK